MANVGFKRSRPIPAHEYVIRLQYLEHKMSEYEAQTRLRSGSNRGGVRVLHGDTFAFAKYALERAWLHLAEMQATRPDQYQNILSGGAGQWLRMPLCIAAYAAINQHTVYERHQFKHDSTSTPRTQNGTPIRLDNSRRSAHNWRKKLCAEAQITHRNGEVSPGFDLFKTVSTVWQDGTERPGGRSASVVYINLDYVLGPHWSKKSEFAQNQQVAPGPLAGILGGAVENFSAKTPYLSEKEKEKEESGIFGVTAAEPQQPENTKTEDQKGVSTPDATYTNLDAEKDQLPARGAAARWFAALRLWAFLLTRIYLPMIAAGRVRYNASKIYTKTTVSPQVQHNSALQLVEFLKKYPENVLREAITAQAEWLEADSERWMYTPGTFLNPDTATGSLSSAIRQFVRSETPALLTEIPDDGDVNARVMRLYHRIVALGCEKTRLHTWLRWHQQHGLEYLSQAVAMFQAAVHTARQQGRPVGREFEGGNSKHLARLVYYGHERVDAFVKKNRQERLNRLLQEANRPDWAPLIEQVQALDAAAITELNRLSLRYLGTRISKYSEVSEPKKAVALAWCYREFGVPQQRVSN